MTTQMGCLPLAVMQQNANTLALCLWHIFIWNTFSSWKSSPDYFWGVFATQSCGLYAFKEQKPCILPPHHPLEKLLLPFLPEQSQAVITSSGLESSSLQLPWDGPKFLIFLQEMSFSDRRICLKLPTLTFLTDVAQALSPWSRIWWMCWHFSRHRKSFDRASFPHSCDTGIVEAHKYLPVWTEIYPSMSSSYFIHN